MTNYLEVQPHRVVALPIIILNKIPLCMKLTVLMLFLSIGLIQATSSYGQSTTLSLEVTNATVQDVLDKIESQSDFHFFYNNKQINTKRVVSIKKTKENVFVILNELFDGTDVSYQVMDKNIILSNTRKADKAQVLPQAGNRITGVVTDASGEPIIGANVFEKGSTTNGTITDIDGRFTLEIPSNGSLVVSYIGYQTQTVSVANRKDIKIQMKEDSELIEEVVVVGYGSQKKANLTGAVSNINVSDALQNRPIADVGRGLQGASSGLSVIVPSGEIGSDPLIKIRGQIGSIQGGSSPLILLDNVEIPSIQMVNPDDIETISVLKDAASSSIYGAKAAFGVILITTKKGAKTESVNISYSNNFSWQNVAKDMRMGDVDAMEYTVNAFERVGSTYVGALNWYVTRESWEKAKAWKEQYGNTIGADDPMTYGRDWEFDAATNRKYGYRTYDPYDYMIREWAPSQTHNLSLNGKSGKTSYNIGLGYLNQNGMMKPAKKDDFTRYNASIRLSTELNKYVTVRGGLLYSKRDKRYPYVTNATTADPWLYLYRWGPTMPIGYDDQGVALRGPASESSQANTANILNNYTNINIGATINITKDWTVDADYTYANEGETTTRPGTRYSAGNTWAVPTKRLDEAGKQVYVNAAGQFVDASTPGALAAYEFANIEYTGKGSNPDHIYRKEYGTKRSTLNAFTTYNLSLNDIHSFKFMGGINRVTFDETMSAAQRTQLIDINNPQFSLANGAMTTEGGNWWEAQLGYFGRVNYTLYDRYLLEANIRYDGTSKFPNQLRWRWYPSFSAGWRASEEAFMEWAKPMLSTLKFRGSWGSIGDQTVPNNLYVPTMNSFDSSWLSSGGTKFYGFNAPAAVARSISWQNIETLDLGLDLRVLDNKLGMTFDWYRRDTKDMIIPGTPVADTYGTTSPKQNFGALRTNGWEISVDFNHRFENGLGINATLNVSDAVTKVTDYLTDVESVGGWYKGKTYGEIWGYRTDRLYQMDDFELDANGKPYKIVLSKEESAKYAGKTVYKLKSKNGEKPVYQPYLQNSSTFFFGPGDVKFVDLNGDGELNNGTSTVKDHGDLEVIGNTTPRYEYSLRLGADYKGFDVSIFFQGVGKREIWGGGSLAIPGFNTADGAMPQAFAGDFWREDRTNAFYPRPWNMGGSNSGNNLQVQSRYLLDMSYLRVKNMTVGYTLPSALLKKAYINNARVYVSLENFLTFDNLNDLPIDPESISGYSMYNSTNYNLGRTGTGTPTFKSVSFGLQLGF